jgi:hypothetical protein
MLTAAWQAGTFSAAQLRPLALEAARALGDGTPGELHEVAARLCIETGEVDCARFHALRAAVAGTRHAGSLLAWLRDHHPDPQVRSDAAAWLATLTAGKRDSAVRE